MKIVKVYSHLNGLEYLQVHKPNLWREVTRVIKSIDAAKCMTKVSKEVRMQGQIKFSPKDLNLEFNDRLSSLQWQESRVTYWVTDDERLIRRTLPMSAEDQKAAIIAAGSSPIMSYNQTDFVKDRVAIEVQFGKYAFVAYDLFVKHLAFLRARRDRCRDRNIADEGHAVRDVVRARLLRRRAVQRHKKRPRRSECSVGDCRNRALDLRRATFLAMHSAAIYFSYFWHSPRPAAGEAPVHAS